MDKIIAYDLGTGGLKASLFDKEGRIITSEFTPYKSYNISASIQEQAPMDWWKAICETTKRLIEKSGIESAQIAALAISGHSLGVVPIDKSGELLLERTPIWSDKRATEEAKEFFKSVDYKEWYETTGNGFPAECYSIFKILWYKKNYPEFFAKIDKVIGTKDFCNFMFTSRAVTDYSYASGSGVYSLEKWDYVDSYIEAAGVSRSILPDIIASDGVVGYVSEDAAKATGLHTGVKVIAGGVDNSCMALGAGGVSEGTIYTSLGSSAWIALTSSTPVINFTTKPYVFAHVIKGMYASATAIFSAGSSLKWVAENMFTEFLDDDLYGNFNKFAAKSPIGASNLFFNPSLAGGSMLEESSNICGSFSGLNLSHTKCDIARATMEGVALNLRMALDELLNSCGSVEKMLIVGGGSKSPLWMQIFANCYNITTVKTAVDQQAASLGAAALAAVGAGIWENYENIINQHSVEAEYEVEEENALHYEKSISLFRELSHFMSIFGDKITNK